MTQNVRATWFVEQTTVKPSTLLRPPFTTVAWLQPRPRSAVEATVNKPARTVETTLPTAMATASGQITSARPLRECKECFGKLKPYDLKHPLLFLIEFKMIEISLI